MKTFYDQNLERFKQGDSVHAAHILIGVPQSATPEQKAEAKTKASGGPEDGQGRRRLRDAGAGELVRIRAARRTAATSASSRRGR